MVFIEIIMLGAKVVILNDFNENLSFFELALSCLVADQSRIRTKAEPAKKRELFLKKHFFAMG